MSVSADDSDDALDLRGVTAFERTGSAPDRDQSAKLRDVSATACDWAADVRDRAAARREDTLAALAGGDSPIAAVLAASAAVRRQAAADRAQAAEDRRSAAADRTRAAADRRQSRIGLARAHIDGLTGVFTRQVGLARMGHEIVRARRSGGPFSLAYIDVDGMKDPAAGADRGMMRTVRDGAAGVLRTLRRNATATPSAAGIDEKAALVEPKAALEPKVVPRAPLPDHRVLDQLTAEARHHRERYDLYQAKMYGLHVTSQTRLNELQRACEGAAARLAAAKATQRHVQRTPRR